MSKFVVLENGIVKGAPLKQPAGDTEWAPVFESGSGLTTVELADNALEPVEGSTWNGTIFTDPEPVVVVVTPEQKAELFQLEREAKLADCDYAGKVIVDLGALGSAIPQKYVDLAQYRMDLRDLPEAVGFDAQDPDSYTWPTDPRA